MCVEDVVFALQGAAVSSTSTTPSVEFVKNVVDEVAQQPGMFTEFSVSISNCVWLGSRVVSLLDSEGPGFKSQSRRCRVTVLGKLFTPIVPLFTKQQNW